MTDIEKCELYLEISEIVESIAYANQDFICTKCLDTIDRLNEIIRNFCGYDFYVQIHEQAEAILYAEEYDESEDEE